MHPLGVLDSGGRATEVIIDRDTRYGINAYDYFVYKIGRTPRTTEKVHFIVATDIMVVGPTTALPAIDFDNRWTVDNKVTLTNYGFILGRGGKGGQGGDANNKSLSYGAKSWNSNIRGAQFHTARAGGNGGLALRSTTTTVVVDNHKLIASGGGGGGGSGGWTCDKQNDGHGTAKINNTVSFQNSSRKTVSVRVNSNGGGSSGTAGSPFGEWVPHTMTEDWWLASFPAGSRQQRLINHLIRGVYPVNTVVPPDDEKIYRHSIASTTTALELINLKKYPTHKGLETFTEAEFKEVWDKLRLPGGYNLPSTTNMYTTVAGPAPNKTLAHQIRPYGWHRASQGGENSVFVKHWGLKDSGDVNVKIRSSETEVYDNLLIFAPYKTQNDASNVDYKAVWANSAYTPKNAGRYPFTAYGTTSAPTYVGAYSTGHPGYPGAQHFRSMGNTGNRMPQGSLVWRLDGFNIVFNKPINREDLNETRFTYHMIESHVHKDAQGYLTRPFKEEEYYSGGKGGVLGDDGQPGTLNKIWGWDHPGLPNYGTRFNIAPQYASIFYITEPAAGGKGGRIWSGRVNIKNRETGIMRGYVNATTKQLPEVPVTYINKLKTKSVDPMKYMLNFDKTFKPGFDPYTWDFYSGILLEDISAFDTMRNNEMAKKLLNVPIAHQLTQNIFFSSKIFVTPELNMLSGGSWLGEEYVVIPAGYISAPTHLPWLLDWKNRIPADPTLAKTKLNLAIMTEYLIETLRIYQKVAFRLIPVLSIPDVLANYNQTVPGQPQLISELRSLINEHLHRASTNDQCVVNIEKQKLVRDSIEWYRQTGKWE